LMKSGLWNSTGAMKLTTLGPGAAGSKGRKKNLVSINVCLNRPGFYAAVLLAASPVDEPMF
jgi:hypothetical protein